MGGGLRARWLVARRAALPVLAAAVLVACGGGGGSGDEEPSADCAPCAIAGRATYDSVPSANGQLAYDASSAKPIRGATVQLLDGAGAVLDSTATDADGSYQLQMPSALQFRVRVRAEARAATHDFSVRDNTEDGALYVLDSSLRSPAGATTTVDLRATSGWNGSSYNRSQRTAAPFAILDVAVQVKDKILVAAPGDPLPALRVYWSPDNRPADGSVTTGAIGTSFFTTADDLPGNPNGNAIFVLGAENSDTDEYDVAVVAHEMGHYLQSARSRDDSPGGPHGPDDRLDPRVAFSEGWGNAWSSMVRNDSLYSDAIGTRQRDGFSFDLDSTPPPAPQGGWFNEESVGHLLWRLHQDAQVGWDGIYAALVQLRSSAAFTTVHGFVHQLKAARPAAASSIASRAAALGIGGSDAFGSGEGNDGGVAEVLPLYIDHVAGLGVSQQYCVRSPFGSGNRLGNFAFVRFAASGARTLRVTRAAGTAAATDPDLLLLQSDATRRVSDGVTPNEEVLSATLPVGTHVLAINDFELSVDNAVRCFDLTIQ